MTEHSPNTNEETHLQTVVNYLLGGRIVPFLGAGVNLCGDADELWDPERRLPNGKELSRHIANKLPFPPEESTELASNLARVSQYANLLHGRGHLNAELRLLFEKQFPVTPLHSFLASLPSRCPPIPDPRTYELRKHFLVVTTNYDDVMEQAFRDAGEKVHVVTYLSKRDRPAFRHQPPEGEAEIITTGTDYQGLNDDEYPVLLKVHGSVDRENVIDPNNFVITEDDYLEYLSFGDIAQALPRSLIAQLKQSSFLFLGYGLHDWNMRAFLGRIWRAQNKGAGTYVSWAVMKEYSAFEKEYWEKKDVKIFQTTDLINYVEQLEARFSASI